MISMPYITIESGKLTKEQKNKLVSKLTQDASEIMNIPSEFIMMTIKELDDDSIGIGGRTIDVIKSE